MAGPGKPGPDKGTSWQWFKRKEIELKCKRCGDTYKKIRTVGPNGGCSGWPSKYCKRCKEEKRSRSFAQYISGIKFNVKKGYCFYCNKNKICKSRSKYGCEECIDKYSRYKRNLRRSKARQKICIYDGCTRLAFKCVYCIKHREKRITIEKRKRIEKSR